MRRRALFRLRIWTAPVATAAIVGVLLSTGGAAFGAPRVFVAKPQPPQVPSVHDLKPLPTHFAKQPALPQPYKPAKVTWPAAVSTTLMLDAPKPGAARGPRATGAGTPIWASATGKSAATGVRELRVKVLDHAAAQAAGVPGVLFTVSAEHAGSAQVGVDYSDFAQAYGGNYGARLGLATYPSCVLTTPTVAACRVATPLVSVNNPTTRSVSATVAIAGNASASPPGSGVSAASGTLVLAAAAVSTAGGNGGSGGTYSATSLSASGSWSGGGNSGDFTYSYPIVLPSAPSDLTPSVDLSYDSGATDAENATSQPQASWVGEGWNTPDSFIEQSFQSCSESPEGTAAPTKTYDQCYDGPIYTLSLNGSSTALVWDSTKNVFKPASSNGAVIKHLCTLPSGATSFTDPTCVAGANNATGTKFNDWWQIIYQDGTTYSFGMNHLPGWATGKTATSSVATEPVYSAHSGDPCYSSAGFSASVCTVPYRWGLDYVTDVHSNAMSYYYHQDSNFYGAYNGASMKQYVRDQYLDHIDYGYLAGNAYGIVPDKVIFHAGGRCLSGTCAQANSPDVPYDQICASGSTCTSHAPAFFSMARLTSIETQQYVVSTATYATIDSYALQQSVPQTGDGTSATLWLSQIQHTGSALAAGPKDGLAKTLPPVTFTPSIQMDSRLDTVSDGLPAFKKYRLQTITTETGSQITVAYGLPNPCSASAKPAASANASSCYPVSWTPPGYTAPITDWFNKYAVTMVTQTDPTGGAAQLTTRYKYQGGAAWHYDVNELVKAKYRTYGQFRGYGDVITYLGELGTDAIVQSEATYYRGMSKNNSSTVLNLPDSQGGVHEDIDQLAGRTLETSAFLGSVVDHSTITSYWVSTAAATRTRAGLPDLTSTQVAPVETFTRQALTSTGSTTWRYTATDTSYDASTTSATFGLPTRSYTHTVPPDAAYDSCTSTSYAAANTAKNLVGLGSEVETDSVACGGYTAGKPPSAPGSVNTLTAPAAVSRPDQVISDVRTFYDDTNYATTFPQTSPPSAGDVTMTRTASGYSGGAFTWQTTARAKFDSIGRQTDAYDGAGNHTGTTYTANSVGLTTSTVTTNALNQATTTTVDVQRGLTLTSTDPNTVVTTHQYDTLGREAAIWLDSRTIGVPANYQFSYAVANDGPTAVTTKTLNDEQGYRTDTTIYDGLFRQRQIQTETPRGGRLISDTFYDTRGWVSAKYTKTNDTGATPSTTIADTTTLQLNVSMQNVYVYNSLGQVVIDHNRNNTVAVSDTTTVYNGDRTTVIPPDGGTVTTTLTDPLGRTSEIDNYVARPIVNSPADPFTGTFTVTGGSKNVITYGYDGHGNQNSTTQGQAGSNGPTWTSTYNLLGQVTKKVDPDAGQTTDIAYDAAGNLAQSTDGRGKTISYTYDGLNRKTGMFDSTVATQQPANPAAGTTGNQLGGWVYDNSNTIAGVTHAIGHLTTANTYLGGSTYSSQQLDFNVFGESIGTSLTIPASENGLAGTYRVRHLYTPTLGLPLFDLYDAGGGLPKEQVSYSYRSQFDLPDSVGGLSSYTQSTSYDAYSRVNELTIGRTATVYSTIDNTYDPNSGRLTSRSTKHTDNGTVTAVDQQAYTYDKAGNITGQTSTRQGSASTAETQCYNYDGLDQLVAAWTANDQCAVAPTSANSSMVADSLGASAAYWTTWNIDALGDRTGQTQHSFTGGPSADTNTTYTYGAAGGQPHTLTSTSTTGASTGSTSYSYDPAGNMKTRNAGQGDQSIGYDNAGRLTSVTGSTAGDSTYEYDADGTLLIQKNPGTTTLYFGNQQYSLTTATSVVTGTRYYALPDGSSAIRTGTSTTAFSYAIADPHGTPSLYLDYTATTATWRQYTPYGAPRGAAVSAPDNRGFLNKPMDTTTSLTIVGARQYDPDTGRFITDDPVLEQTDPTQLNGYAYAGNNPVVRADPTGLWAKDPELDDQFGRPKEKGTGHSNHSSPGGGGTSANDSGGKKVSRPISKESSAFGRNVLWNPMLAQTQAQIDANSKRMNGLSWAALAFAFATGIGLPEYRFYQVDDMTMSVRGTSHMSDVRRNLSSMIAKGGYNADPSENSGDWSYDLPEGDEGRARAAADGITILLGVGGKDTHGASFIGSYKLKPKVMAVDSRTGKAVVSFHAWNVTDLKSGTRIPGSHKTQGGSGGPSGGPVSTIREDFYWSEVIDFTP